MTGLTDTAARAALNALVAAHPHVALFTVAGTDAGTGFTEVMAGGYARFDATGLWNAATGSAPSTITNSADFPFGPASADWGALVAVGLFSLPTGGVLGAWDFLGGFPWRPCEIAVPGMFLSRGHGLSVNDRVAYTTEYGGVAPSFSQSNLTGALFVASAATDTFAVANAGIPVVVSIAGDGLIRKIAAQRVDGVSTTGITIPSGSLIITQA